jgi:hypothetical protein
MPPLSMIPVRQSTRTSSDTAMLLPESSQAMLGVALLDLSTPPRHLVTPRGAMWLP